MVWGIGGGGGGAGVAVERALKKGVGMTADTSEVTLATLAVDLFVEFGVE